MNEENGRPEFPPSNGQESPRAALIVAFLPLALLLLVTCLMKLHFLGGKVESALLFLACAISMTCCIKGSFMLLARKTTLAVLCGIAFMLLNGFIAWHSFVAAMNGFPQKIQFYPR